MAPDPCAPVRPGAVDPTVLRRLEDVMGDGFAREVTALYHVTAFEKVAAVVQAAAEQAPTRALAAAHSLVSCAGNVGATGVQALARAIEVGAASGRVPDAAALAALEQALADSGPALDAVIDALTSAAELPGV